MIIWIASYPKSGNTWVRSLISLLLFSKDGIMHNFELLDTIDQYPTKKYFKNLVKDFNDGFEIQKNWIPSQKIINKDKKIKLFKTHHIYCKYGNHAFTDSLNTMGVIHVVRDPRNLILSIKKLWSLKDNYEAMSKLLDAQNATGMKIEKDKDYSFPVMISSWKNHYNAWKKIKKNYLLIRYEDIIENPKLQIINIANYLKKFFKFDINDKKIQNIVNTTSFNHFQKLEAKGFFNEANLDQNGIPQTFFNNGPKMNYQNKLKTEIYKKIENELLTEMKELNYF